MANLSTRESRVISIAAKVPSPFQRATTSLFRRGSGRRTGDPLLGHGALTEPVPETAVDFLEVSHAPDPLRSSSARLLTPVEFSHAFLWVAASRAELLLDVIAPRAAATTQRVRLVVALAKARRTLRHYCE